MSTLVKTAGETPFLAASGLVKHFRSRAHPFASERVVRAVDGVDLSISKGETLAVVGESGCGKSTLGRLLLRLIEPDAGTVLFDGTPVTGLGADALRRRRGAMQMVFQDPFASLNPRFRVEQIIGEPLWVHRVGTVSERRARVAELLRLVGLLPEHAGRFPHEFSGGQRQRIGIARALASRPTLIIGDEPVSALDVSIQAQVINLLEDLKDRLGLTLMFISHDLGVVRHVSDRVAVMYLGQIVEIAPTDALFNAPLHPYTQALLGAIPVRNPAERRARTLVGGDVPSPSKPPGGCRFHTRCPHVRDQCRVESPVLTVATTGATLPRQVACHFWPEIASAGASPAPARADSPAKARRLALYGAIQAQRKDAGALR